MPANPAPAATRRATSRRACRAVPRIFHPSQIITLALALVLGGAGGAAAASAAPFLLGRANRESATASLTDTRGTPLSLSAPARKAPLKVNRRTLIKNLNAQYVSGFAAGRLVVLGGDMYTPPGTDTPINSTGKLLVTTGPLPAGIYYVTATAELNLDPNDVNGQCWIGTGSSHQEPGRINSGRRGPAASAAASSRPPRPLRSE